MQCCPLNYSTDKGMTQREYRCRKSFVRKGLTNVHHECYFNTRQTPGFFMSKQLSPEDKVYGALLIAEFERPKKLFFHDVIKLVTGDLMAGIFLNEILCLAGFPTNMKHPPKDISLKLERKQYPDGRFLGSFEEMKQSARVLFSEGLADYSEESPDCVELKVHTSVVLDKLVLFYERLGLNFDPLDQM